MDKFDRFYATINRQEVDRPASWLGIPDAKAIPILCKYFNVPNLLEVKKKIDDDVYPVELPYHSPTSNAIYAAFDFAKDSKARNDARSLTVPGYFENMTDPNSVSDFPWPDPYKYIDSNECKRVVDEAPKNYPVLGVLWSAHFQDACSAFGMETAFIKMLTEPEMYKAVIDKITEFYLNANEIFYSATKDRLNGVLLGNDFGSQTSLLLSPDMIKEFVLPGIKKLVHQAKSYGLKVIYHSCGSIIDIIPSLIEAGVDVIHPIQALATGMDPNNLKQKFGGKVSFCGGVDAQNLLINGTPEEVANKVKELKTIFPTGLIISPSHEAILPDISPQNVEALFNAVKS